MKRTKLTINLEPMKEFRAQLAQYRTRVGVIGSKASEQHEGTDATNAEIGFVQIFGSITNNIPPRDFLLMPVQHERKEIVRQVNSAVSIKRSLIAGETKKAFALIGKIAEGVVQAAFDTGGFGQWAPLKASTIAAKGSDSMLIDTGQLRRAVSSDVVGASEI